MALAGETANLKNLTDRGQSNMPKTLEQKIIDALKQVKGVKTMLKELLSHAKEVRTDGS